MRTEKKTFEIAYTMFDVGEKVRPSSKRCSLPDGIYTVTECIAPITSDQNSSVVFVKGHKYGISGEYLTTANSAFARP